MLISRSTERRKQNEPVGGGYGVVARVIGSNGYQHVGLLANWMPKMGRMDIIGWYRVLFSLAMMASHCFDSSIVLTHDCNCNFVQFVIDVSSPLLFIRHLYVFEIVSLYMTYQSDIGACAIFLFLNCVYVI